MKKFLIITALMLFGSVAASAQVPGTASPDLVLQNSATLHVEATTANLARNPDVGADGIGKDLGEAGEIGESAEVAEVDPGLYLFQSELDMALASVGSPGSFCDGYASCDTVDDCPCNAPDCACVSIGGCPIKFCLCRQYCFEPPA